MGGREKGRPERKQEEAWMNGREEERIEGRLEKSKEREKEESKAGR